VTGIAGVTAALVFAASLGHLIDTPHLYGWSFNVKGEVPTEQPCADGRDHGIVPGPAIEAVGTVCSTVVPLDGRPVTVWGFQSLHGTIAPEVVDGRAPLRADEIALGKATLDALDKRVGDRVTARGPEEETDLTIVGRIVLPTIGDPQALADGGAVVGDAFAALYGSTGENETEDLVARVKPAADVGAVKRDLEETVRRIRNIGSETVPVEVDRLQQIDRIPAALAALLGVLALIAVGHAVVTSVRRRRRELALLKVLGFSRGQVRATVAWQATTLAAIGLGLGIPIGIIVGRLAWQAVADGLGVAVEVATPTLWLGLSVPTVLVLVNLIALLPAQAAARTRPAVALRST
jgi:hypothetical protein